ncbi:MAG: outer membrane beta-barrel protein, partial [Bacteroidota bacterium]
AVNESRTSSNNGSEEIEEELTPSVGKKDNASQEAVDQRALANGSTRQSEGEEESVLINRIAVDESAEKVLIFPNEEVSQREAVLLSIDHRVGRLAALPPDAVAMNKPSWSEGVEKLYLVPQYREEATSKQEKKGAQFFAGLAMAPSLFDPNFQTGRGPASADFAVAESLSPQSFNAFQDNGYVARFSSNSPASPQVIEEGLDNQSSLSFSYGFNFGLELGEHWSIESGLDFQNFQTTTETRYTVVDLQSGERYPLVATNALANAATSRNTTPIGDPSEVDNQFQFISVPILIGYNVRFSKVTFSVNPGVAANLFLGNRITSEQYSSATISRDGSSPFNSQYFSGLISGGIFYQFVENYSLSFTPSYQFALTDLANTQATFSSQPQSFGLRLGFRYTFR